MTMRQLEDTPCWVRYSAILLVGQMVTPGDLSDQSRSLAIPRPNPGQRLKKPNSIAVSGNKSMIQFTIVVPLSLNAMLVVTDSRGGSVQTTAVSAAVA